MWKGINNELKGFSACSYIFHLKGFQRDDFLVQCDYKSCVYMKAAKIAIF